MRIGIDARELCGKPTGVGRYLRGLLTCWSEPATAERHTFLLYAHETPTTFLPASFSLRLVPGSGGTWWEQCRLPIAANRDRPDVFFAPAYSAPLLLRVPFVVTVHDLSFVAHPEWFRPREGVRRRWLTRWSAHHARVVLTDSEFSRGEIIARLGVSPSRVRAVRLGITPPAAPANPPPCRDPTVLFVGSIFNRRRLPDLIRAFTQLAAESLDVRLDIVGDDRTYPRQDLTSIIAAEGLEGRVAIRSYVSDDALADLYRRASVFAFLSEYEGFGLTPLEALASGAPVVTLDTAVARETCGGAALYVSAGDLAGISGALRSAMYDEGVRARLLAHAAETVARYSWSDAARETLAAIEGVAWTPRD
jgi:glycosyltransferase involved in cell wall biosynthesis